MDTSAFGLSGMVGIAEAPGAGAPGPAPGALVAVPEDAAEPLVSLWPQALRPSARAAVADRVTMCLSIVVLTCCFLVWR